MKHAIQSQHNQFPVGMLWNVIIFSDMLRLSNQNGFFSREIKIVKSKKPKLLLQKVSFECYWSWMVEMETNCAVCSVEWQHAVFF